MSEKTQKLYKTDTDARELAERLFEESGIKFEGDFFAHVMSTYELQQMKNGLGIGYQKQISSLEYHMKSVVDTFTAMLSTEAGDRLQLAEGYEAKLSGLAVELSTQQDEISEYKKREQLMSEEQAKILKRSEDQVKEIASLGQINDKNEEILAENKERVERLSKLVADGQDAVIQKQEIEARISEISKISEVRAKELLDARDAIEALRLAHEEQLRQLIVKNTDEQQIFAERAENIHSGELLALERRLQQEHIAERSELAREIRQTEKDHAVEIRKLYGEMDNLRQQLSAVQQPRVNARGKGETRDDTGKEK
jgi:hypothetical protein